MTDRIVELHKTSVEKSNAYLALGYQLIATSQESEPDTHGVPVFYVVAIVGRPEGVVHACPRCYEPMPDWDAKLRGSRNRMCGTCYNTPQAVGGLADFAVAPELVMGETRNEG